ncbi:hypothetical protein [uncultured Microbulbifer sp.]|uniref:hypothetical protein n=1 Tax=uncultured Microbulbifer sp. TaxID=348147 RepID=UPI0025E89DF6|nr:hypothetical protein [uncultured Microbulbifer sp.]
MKKTILVLLLSTGLVGCETLTRIALEGATNSRVRYGSQCESLRLQCRAENYSEWETSEGKRGCSCAGESSQSRAPGDMQDPI